ncbi:MAG: lipocalin-like domain-containing protein [Pseudomonadota bacterium]
MRRRFSRVLLLIGLLAGCDESPEDTSQTLQLEQVLGGGNTEGFLRAESPREFSFPADHGSHPGFRNEWWYLTGNLQTEEGRRFGYQVTFFNAAMRPPGAADANSAWDSERLWMAHFAITDVQAGNHDARERFSRENPGLAGAQVSPFKVWLEDWTLTAQSNDYPWHLQVADQGLGLTLDLTSSKPPVLQGDSGLSQKSPAAGNASYYYSLTRMPSSGEITIGSEVFSVSGNSWLDREWSTSALADDQTGWDWFSLQFADGQELMYYQLRTSADAAHSSSQGNWTDQNGNQQLIRNTDISLEETASWTSPAGVVYATEWHLRYKGQEWRIKAVVDAQLMELTIPYWEGAVDVFDMNGTEVGRGYLEMVRQ